jgi:hypothetical protein
METVAEDVLKRSDAAFEIQQQHIGTWTEAALYSLNRRIWLRNQVGQIQPYTPNPDLQNTTAVNALNQMAAGMQSAFVSAGEAWWIWEPADELPNPSEELRDWFANATRIALRQLGPSGFYASVGDLLKDAGCVGTSIMDIRGPVKGSNSPINCETWDIGSFAIQQNAAGYVDCVWREFTRTVAQAEREWPDYTGKSWSKLKPEEKMKKEQTFIMEIMPRDAYDVGQKPGRLGMPIRVTIIHKDDKAVVHEGGLEEMSAIAYRFQKQSGCNPWGIGPGIYGVPDARSVNWLDAQMADGVGKMVDPPIALKGDMRGPADLRSGGTVIVDNLADAPRPVIEVGNMQTGEVFLDKKQRQLRNHFFADLFAFFMDDRSYKTATEVMEIKAEKLDLFGPLGHHFLTEFVDRALERMFMLLFRAGLFGQPPREAWVRTPGGWKFLYPKSVQQSRMALLLRQQGNREIRQLLMDIAPIATIDPAVLNNLNFNAIVRKLASGSVAMYGITRTPDDAAFITKQQQMAAQAAEQQKMLADFATKNPDHAAQLAGIGAQAA